MYPIAFIEFRKDVDGKVTREGPRREKEELAAHDVWLVSACTYNPLICLPWLSGSARASTSAFGKKERRNRTFSLIGPNVSKPNPVLLGIQKMMARSKLSLL